ncbi:DUF6986 family protein [Lapillicoccus jejuensis]|nr:aldolase/citrate lyase family protein [Lapillicoccus jejuensis]
MDTHPPTPPAVPSAAPAHVQDLAARLDAELAAADARVAARYPGDPGTRQPVHTLYVPADRVDAGLVPRYGAAALEVLARYLPDAAALADVVGTTPDVADAVLPLVRAKLEREPVEDLRVDLEDGYGTRPDAEEDAAAVGAVRALLAAATGGTGTPYGGVRVKSLEQATRHRGLRTLDLVLGELARAGAAGGCGGRRLPHGFVVTLPKVTAVEQVAAMVTACEVLEERHGLAPGEVRFEIQVETPQSVVTADGVGAVPLMIAAARGRCIGLHYGTYDYSASLGIAAAQQSLEHPVADHAKAVLQVAAAGTGVRLSDGSTNVLPVGDDAAVLAALRQHARLVRRGLERGFMQGWDLHPAQLPTRYAATFAFYREGLPDAAARLRAWAGEASGTGVLDEPATVRALAWYVVRGLDCGAVRPEEPAAWGTDEATLRALAHPRGR